MNTWINNINNNTYKLYDFNPYILEDNKSYRKQKVDYVQVPEKSV
jgi:hypothetical protein